MKSIVFRTMGGTGIGYGHFFRCYSLAKAFKNIYKNINIIFIVNRELEGQFLDPEFEYLILNSFNEDINLLKKLNPKLFILDTYLANNSYLTQIKEITKLMIFDDNNDIYDSTIPDILLNGNIHAEELNYKMNKDSLYLLGPKYLVMKEEYWKENIFKDEQKDGILITTGGTDPYEISYNILKNITKLPYKKRVIIGPGYEKTLIEKLEKINDKKIELIYKPKSLKKYIERSKIAITAGGSTIYEVLSKNTIPIIFSMADNQDKICEYFSKIGILYIGKYPKIKYDDVSEKIIKLMEEKMFNNNIFSLVDGQGVKNVVRALK